MANTTMEGTDRRAGKVRRSASTAPVLAAALLSSNPPHDAVDGDLETSWVSGGSPQLSIQVDLGGACTIANVELVVEQSPLGATVHRIWGIGPGSGGSDILLHEFTRSTTSGDILSYSPPKSWRKIRLVKVETACGPSWVPWREIVVRGLCRRSWPARRAFPAAQRGGRLPRERE